MSDDLNKNEQKKEIEDILNFVKGSMAKENSHQNDDLNNENSEAAPLADDVESNEQEAEKINTDIDSIQNVPIFYEPENDLEDVIYIESSYEGNTDEGDIRKEEAVNDVEPLSDTSAFTDTSSTSVSELDLTDNEAERPDNTAIEGKDIDKPLIYIKENDTDLSELFGSELTYSKEIDIISIVSRLNSLNNDEDYNKTVTNKLSGIEQNADDAVTAEAAIRKSEEEKDMTVRVPVTSPGSQPDDTEPSDENSDPVVIYTNDEEVAAEETSPSFSSDTEDSFITAIAADFSDDKSDTENGESSDDENTDASTKKSDTDDSDNSVEITDGEATDFVSPDTDGDDEPQDGEEDSNGKSKIIIPIIIILLLFGAAAFFYFFVLNGDKNQNNASSTAASSEAEIIISQMVSEVESKIYESSMASSEESEPEEPVYTGPYSNLTGLPIDADKLDNRPVAFMINNIETAQPLLGISKADIVYEMVVEGGITRLLGVFGNPADVSTIGSIRSARPDFIYIAKGLDAIFFHVGTSVQAQELLDTGIITSFDLGIYDSLSWRDNYRMNNLGYEHSLVTSGDTIASAMRSYDVRTMSDSNKGFAFSDASQVISGEKAVSMTARFSTYKTTSFEYNEKKKNYNVYQFGSAQYDGQYGENNTVGNVIAIFTNVYQIDDEGHMSVDVIGSGSGYYMSHGRIIPITWAKSSAAGAMLFYTMDGKPLEMFRGKTYVCVLPSGMDALSWE